MMKRQSILLLLVIILAVQQQGIAQNKLVPSTSLITNRTIQAERQTATWYLWQDTTRREIGTVTTIIDPAFQGNKVLVVQQIALKGSPAAWADTTVVLQSTMAPVYHSSFNGQRNMVLRFDGKQIDGYYKKQQDPVATSVHDQIDEPFFDSNFYPQLIRFLPLETGYQAVIPIYDYNPGKHGLLFARIVDVREMALKNKTGQETPCYAVRVSDDISPESQMVHYISKANRALLKSEIVIGTRRMSIE
jgi:hypothetical protein